MSRRFFERMARSSSKSFQNRPSRPPKSTNIAAQWRCWVARNVPTGSQNRSWLARGVSTGAQGRSWLARGVSTGAQSRSWHARGVSMARRAPRFALGSLEAPSTHSQSRCWLARAPQRRSWLARAPPGRRGGSIFPEGLSARSVQNPSQSALEGPGPPTCVQAPSQERLKSGPRAP